VRNACIIAIVSSLAALLFNAARPNGLELFAKTEYEVFVPCPEPIKEVTSVEPFIIKPGDPVLLIDARPESSFVKSSLRGALHLEFDYLYPVADSAVKGIAASKAHRIVVYGDGKRPDPGHELGRELAGRGIRNVTYIAGGYEKAITLMDKR
jgi:hypothetical protein